MSLNLINKLTDLEEKRREILYIRLQDLNRKLEIYLKDIKTINSYINNKKNEIISVRKSTYKSNFVNSIITIDNIKILDFAIAKINQDIDNSHEKEKKLKDKVVKLKEEILEVQKQLKIKHVKVEKYQYLANEFN
jgi:hypothetical protein